MGVLGGEKGRKGGSARRHGESCVVHQFRWTITCELHHEPQQKEGGEKGRKPMPPTRGRYHSVLNPSCPRIHVKEEKEEGKKKPLPRRGGMAR